MNGIRRFASISKFVLGTAIVCVGCVGVAVAQPTYSIDFQGPTAGVAPPGPVLEGDILTPIPPGMLPPPAVVIPAGPPGVGLGIVPTPTGFWEVDALSYGTDFRIRQQTGAPLGWSFSVDEFAVGVPGVPFPSVTTEGAFGATEASADIYASPAPPTPVPPGPFGFNVGIFDGNGGLSPFPAPGLNLVEPNPPTPGIVVDLGDNVDAWDIDSPPAFPVYYSMDAAFADPIEGFPANTGTAFANGFVGGDVVVTPIPGGPPLIYAPAPAIGLDLVMGTGSDDLDALVLWENGVPGYQPTLGPFSWLVAGTDMLLYSVRRGSALVGVPDGLFAAPISEGDILVPLGPGVIPGIFTPAELLGLATIRSGTAAFWPTITGMTFPFNDDLNALDVVPEPAGLLAAMAAAAFVFSRQRQWRGGLNET